MATLFDNVISGVVDDNPLSSGATTLNSSALANLSAVTGSDIMWITLDPDAVGGAPEIVKVTAHTASATSATIVRAQQGTTARAHAQNTVWKHAVTAADLDDFNVVTTAKITDANVTTAKIADLGVTTGKLAADAVTGAKIADDQIDSEHYVDGSIDTAHIADAQITLAKMAAESVDSDQYVDGSIDTAHYANASVTAAKLASEAWTSWTPTVTQSGSVTVTNTYSRYARYGRTIHWTCLLDVTGTGTAANAIVVSLPVATAGGGSVNVGQGYILDNGTAYYVGSALTQTSTTLVVVPHNTAGFIGANPSFALASGDRINLSGTYEAAS